MRQRFYSTQPATGTLSTLPVTTQNGSVFAASIARGVWNTAPDAPADNMGNTYAVLDMTHPYSGYPGARTGTYVATPGNGGPNHVFSMTWGDIGGTGDEATVSVVEVRGAAQVAAFSWVEQPAGNTVTSAPVVTTGPALLLAWWWGSGPVNQQHTAVPGDGFTLVPQATELGDNSPNGYIQVAVAAKEVTSAGSYTITWSSQIAEGAQLYLLALQ